GSGYSTIWCSQFVGKVVSVEARKKWFDEIKLCAEQNGINNIELHLFPPEPCAYYEDGSEKWTNRNTLEASDYGLTEEFTGYLKGIERLLDSNHFDVVLVDGHVRKQVVELLIAKNYRGIVLLHDVTPERNYLNGPILSLEGVKIVNQAESLAQLSLSGQKSRTYSQYRRAGTAQELNKIIGFCISRRNDALDFAFHRHFPWLRFEKLRIGPWFVHLWGHGDFSPFISQQNDHTGIVAGYTQQELDFLGTQRLENRGVFIRICRDTIELENDIVGSFRVFYGCENDNVCVSSTEDLVLQSIGRRPIDKTNLVQFLLLGHLTGEQTIWPHIFTMKANSELSFNGNTFENRELAPINFRASGNPVDDLYAITVSTIRKYTDGYEKLFLPLSGGYDSRMLAACIERPQRVTARTYDYIYPLDTGYEASRARIFAKAAGIRDWNICDLGSDFFADYARRWFDIFGASHHLHGMYALSFYDKTIGIPKTPVPILSGFIGDVFVGHQLHAFEEVRNAEPSAKFRRAQFIGPEGFSEEDLRKILNYDIDSLLPTIYARWEQHWKNCEGQEHQKFILNFVRHRARNHISYICTLADFYGAAITPFTDRTYIETVLGLPYKFLFNRLAQQEVFKKYFPSFWPDESKLPGFGYSMDLLCMQKRRLDNIFPIVTDKTVRSHPLLRSETIEQMVREYLQSCDTGDTTEGTKASSSINRLNTLQPLFYSDYLNESKCNDGQDVKTDDVSANEDFRKGVKELQAGNYINALNHFNQAVIACPAMPYTHFGIATAYAQLGDLVSARNACKAELSLCPKNDDARKLLQRIEEETNISASIR
ncbi:MAG: hypothetical protein ABSH16_11475, partial [Sedimentisphaerales bacterium]